MLDYGKKCRNKKCCKSNHRISNTTRYRRTPPRRLDHARNKHAEVQDKKLMSVVANFATANKYSAKSGVNKTIPIVKIME